MLPDRLLTMLWTMFYRFFGLIFFDSIGKGCIFESRVNLPQLRGKIVIGDRVRFCRNVELSVTEGALLFVANDVLIGAYSFISCQESVRIGSFSMLAAFTSIHDNDHLFNDLNTVIEKQGFVKRKVIIGDDCWIGTKSTILRGVHLGDGVVIGANSVVRTSFPKLSVAAGVPAILVKTRT